MPASRDARDLAIGQQPGFGGAREVGSGALSHNLGIGLALRLDEIIEDQVISALPGKLAPHSRGMHRWALVIAQNCPLGGGGFI
jgi:hypothetical protein